MTREKSFQHSKKKPQDLNGVIDEIDGYIHFIKEPESYYLGARYVVIEVESDKLWKMEILKTLLIYEVVAFGILFVFGFFLLQLLLKPMKNTIEVLDRFIKDTTHELNTPISTIANNIELINLEKLDEKNAKRLKRIDIAAKTISSIYQDLTYLTLGHKVLTQDESVNVSEILKERLEFFSILCENKSLHVKKQIEENITLFIDKNRLTKLIDNLLSNAIKYNKQQGVLEVKLSKNSLYVINSGATISKENIEKMFERYTRFNSNVGGFGIGLSIVGMIAKEYGLKIEVTSNKEATCVSVSW
ncbi:MAG: sensor histidine kinase [Campylobacteraceae bacterium]